MIRHQILASALRFYPHESDDPYARYQAACSLVWCPPSTVWVHALCGEFSVRRWFELARWCRDQELQTVRCTRAPGHRLPFAHTEPDGTLRIEVAEVLNTRRDMSWQPTPNS